MGPESGNQRTMKRLKVLILCLALSVAMAACDPAFVRSIQVQNPTPVSMAPLPLSDIDAAAASFGFVRSNLPAGNRETLESQGYDPVAYYERSEPDTSAIEALTISALPDDSGYRLNLFAFIAIGEPDGLRDFRLALTRLLCDDGYVVEGAENCGA